MRRVLTASSIAIIAAAAMAFWMVSAAVSGTGSGGHVSLPQPHSEADARVVSTPLALPDTCVAGFSAHVLDHVTHPTDSPARLYDSNGSGVAADDLDGDGFADIVLGNLEGPNTILWNEGNWTFTKMEMKDRSTRAVNLVDVDADGLLDIVTSHRGSGIAFFKNQGNRRFVQVPLPGVSAKAYSMAWGDVSGDGRLDVVTGSYDAELDQHLKSTFLFSGGAGIMYYRSVGDAFERERLAEGAQALVTTLLDVDHDGHLDVLVGNDFAMHDMAWRNDRDGGLVPFEPFGVMSAHTMTIEAGDIDNDGVEEIFTTDMSPASTHVDDLAAWIPLMATMESLDDPTDPQRIRNVLQIPTVDGYKEAAERAGIDATGWAWSSRFGDLDNDGDTDLYVVNGMIAAETFAYLDTPEIREPNLALANRGDGTFAIADWSLGAEESGRGSVLVDLDNDGRLDIVVNNLDSPSMAFENGLCGGGAIEFSLRQPGSTGNSFALGASVTLTGESGVMVRHVRSGGGYLSGSSTVLHFGVGDREANLLAEVRWPDGTFSTIGRVQAGNHYEVTRW